MRRSLIGVLSVVALWVGVNVGAGYVFRRRRRRWAGPRRHFLVTHGGSEVRPTGEEVQDAVVSVLMGGLVLDLREASVPERPAHLDVMVIMGGVELLVPEDWRVQVDVEPLMGGVRDARSGATDDDRPVDLTLSGRIALGGLDIKSGTRRLEAAER